MSLFNSSIHASPPFSPSPVAKLILHGSAAYLAGRCVAFLAQEKGHPFGVLTACSHLIQMVTKPLFDSYFGIQRATPLQRELLFLLHYTMAEKIGEWIVRRLGYPIRSFATPQFTLLALRTLAIAMVALFAFAIAITILLKALEKIIEQ